MRLAAAWKEHAAPLAWLFAVALVPLGTAPWTGRVPWFSDIANVDFPIRAYTRACFARGEIPWWNPHAACGLPFLADPNTALFYPPTWALALLAPPVALLIDIVLHLFVAGALTYAVARVRGTSRVAATLAGTAFALSGIVFEQIQLPGNLRALALTPSLALGAALLARGQRRRGFVIVALGWTLALFAGHPQLACCALPVAAAVAWGDAPPGGRLRALGTTVGAVFVGSLIAAVALVPAAHFVAVTQRSLGVAPTLLTKDGASLDVVDLARTVFPRLELTTHMALGAGVVALALVAATVRGRASAALIAAAAFGLVAAMGDATPLGGLLHHVPPYSLYQVPTRHLGTAALAFALLAADGLDAWRATAAVSSRRRLAVATVVLALVVTAYVASSGDATRNDVLKLAAIAAVTTAFLVGPSSSPTRASVVLIALVAADLAFQNGRAYWRDDHVAPIATADAPPPELANVPDDARDGSYRILTSNQPWHWHNRPTAFGIDNARGHVAFTPLALLDLSHIVNEGTPLPREPIDTPLYSYAPASMGSPLLDVYAIRYAVGFDRTLGPTWHERAPGVFERDCRMREAHVVPIARFVPTAREAVAAVSARGFDPTWTLVVEGVPVVEEKTVRVGPDPAVFETRRSASGVTVRLSPGVGAWLFAGWNRLPGFEASVDGRPAEVLRADVAFMAVRLPPGVREVNLRYRPAGLVIGALASLGGVIALAITARRLASSSEPIRAPSDGARVKRRT